MKVWVGHGSEHSSRLVLVGHFRDVEKARLTEQRIHALQALALKQPEPDWERSEEWYDEETREALNELRLWQISPADLENFRYEYAAGRDDNRVEIRTDEYEIQGLVKLLILEDARIEVYSRRTWNDDGTPVALAEEEAGNEAEDEASEAE